jgi:transposase InsO family protein
MTNQASNAASSRNIQYRFGAVGKHGSLAVVERFHRTMKELLRLIILPEDQSQSEYEVALIIDWYHDARPHMTLDGKTPNEVYFSREPANEATTHRTAQKLGTWFAVHGTTGRHQR